MTDRDVSLIGEGKSDLITRLLLAGRHPDFAICMEAVEYLEAHAAHIALLKASLRKAEDEAETLKSDAARYRWLRDWQADASDFCCAALEIYLPVPARERGEPPRKHAECFDAAIDAALANQKEGK